MLAPASERLLKASAVMAMEPESVPTISEREEQHIEADAHDAAEHPVGLPHGRRGDVLAVFDEFLANREIIPVSRFLWILRGRKSAW